MVIGTLGKALGSYGAYACASAEMVRYLINTARSLIFSTAPAAARGGGRAGRAGTAARSARTACSGCAPTRACCAARSPREGFPVADCEMHIVPLIVGDEQATMRLCQEAIEQGVFAQAIRPPTVAAGHLAAAPDGDGLPHRSPSCEMAAERLRRRPPAGSDWSPQRDARAARPSASPSRGALEPAGTPDLGADYCARRPSTSSATASCPRSRAGFDGDGARLRRRARARSGDAGGAAPVRARRSTSSASSRAPAPPSLPPVAAHARPVRHGHRHGRRQDGPERRAARGDGRRGRARARPSSRS